MRTRASVLALGLLLALALPASAQVTPGTPPVVFTPTGNTTVYWDASVPTTTAPEDAIVGYTAVAATVVQVASGTNVSIKTWDVGNVTTLTLPGGQLPAIPFFLSVRAKSASGLVSQHSNSLPFSPAGTPSAPPNLRRGTPPQ